MKTPAGDRHGMSEMIAFIQWRKSKNDCHVNCCMRPHRGMWIFRQLDLWSWGKGPKIRNKIIILKVTKVRCKSVELIRRYQAKNHQRAVVYLPSPTKYEFQMNSVQNSPGFYRNFHKTSQDSIQKLYFLFSFDLISGPQLSVPWGKSSLFSSKGLMIDCSPNTIVCFCVISCGKLRHDTIRVREIILATNVSQFLQAFRDLMHWLCFDSFWCCNSNLHLIWSADFLKIFGAVYQESIDGPWAWVSKSVTNTSWFEE